MVIKSTKVAVLGIRTGTSLLTNMLNLAGLSVGDKKNLLNHNNPQKILYGYYENMDVLRINCNILTKYNGTWNNPPVFPLNWWKDESTWMKDLKNNALKIKPILIKDPRLCLTWKFWNNIYNMKPILCMRDVSAVAESLKKAQGINNGSQVWNEYLDSFMSALNSDNMLVKVRFNNLINKNKTINIIKDIFKVHNLEHLYKPEAEKDILNLIDSKIKHAENINNNSCNTSRKDK